MSKYKTFYSRGSPRTDGGGGVGAHIFTSRRRERRTVPGTTVDDRCGRSGRLVLLLTIKNVMKPTSYS